ncbi:MAG: metallophosphoesterase, partial [Lachnospiraceae bacterium]
MKILIVSDTHGYHQHLKTILKLVEPVDLMIHLGDIEGGEELIRSMTQCETYMIAGNNDFFSNLEREKEFTLGKYRILMTHGHYYYVSMGKERIKQEGMERHVDIVMYGHTHRPELDIGKDITVLNPGSVSLPRQEGRRPSFIIMEI